MTTTTATCEIVLSGNGKHTHIHVRPMAIAEVMALQPGSHALAYTGYFGQHRLQGIVHVKTNGTPKTWKTRPGNVKVPIKYGMYEYSYIEYTAGEPRDGNLYFVVETNEPV